MPFGGSCTVSGGDVAGYTATAPVSFKLTQLKGEFVLTGTIEYTISGNIPVTGVELKPNSLFLLKGDSADITANLAPGNATNQEVVWASADDSVATVTNDVVLGVASIELTDSDFDGNQVLFNLYAAVQFNETDNYSNEYFLYLSTDPGFPMGDDELGVPRTLMTNFRIGSPVPTSSIVVNIHEMVDGVFVDTNISNRLVGRDVVLAREISGVAPIDANISYYHNPLYGSTGELIPIELRTSKYTDEVKLVGHVSANGTVVWDVPKEKLKIGGYYLLFDLPAGYVSNLDLYYPYTDDGALVKEVHITRDVVTVRDIYIFKPE